MKYNLSNKAAGPSFQKFSIVRQVKQHFGNVRSILFLSVPFHSLLPPTVSILETEDSRYHTHTRTQQFHNTELLLWCIRHERFHFIVGNRELANTVKCFKSFTALPVGNNAILTIICYLLVEFGGTLSVKQR